MRAPRACWPFSDRPAAPPKLTDRGVDFIKRKVMGVVSPNSVYQWIKNAVSKVLNVWRTVINALPAPLAKFLPKLPTIPWPDEL